jgi:YhcH/YjgK/YiaL family protein
MISDTLSISAIYKHLGRNFEKAFEFLQQADLNSFPLGKHPIDGEIIFMIISEYTTKKVSEARWEAHRRYADIQVLLAGEEMIGFSPLADMMTNEDYNSEKDICYLEGKGDYVTLKPGGFAVFFPHDAHQPGVEKDIRQTVRKMVIKVRVS